MQAIPIYEPGFSADWHWSGGLQNCEHDPELKAILRAGKKLSRKPRFFKVNGNIYTISDEVWWRIKNVSKGS